MAGKQPDAFDTIHLSLEDKKQLIDQIDHDAVKVAPGSNRRRLRVPYNLGQIDLVIAQSERRIVRFRAVPRNLSSHGIAFLHGGFLHAGKPCAIAMGTVDGDRVCNKGWVSTCRHVAALIHEIVVLFDDPIELDRYVQLEPQQQALLDRDRARECRNLALIEVTSPERASTQMMSPGCVW